ncbi:MAG: hypothetical protein KF878_10745 [Planctomycetes bacterium]|nr:hypothetical protein [Planctomycetota bacterium]
MSEAPRIKVEGRARPVCPYCKDEVAGGHVWLCPGCAAAHHADCLAGHGACATCGTSTQVAADPASTSPRLARLRAVLEELGFAVIRAGAGEASLLHPAWRHPVSAEHRAHLVRLVAVDRLTQARAQEDLLHLSRDPLARGDATLLYVT